MPPKSEEHKKFFQLVLAYKKGDVEKDEVSQDVIDTAKDMSKKEIEKFATEPVQEITETEIRKIVREEMRSYGSSDFSEPQTVSNPRLIAAYLRDAELQNAGRGGGDRVAKLTFKSPSGDRLELFVDTANLYKYTS